MPAIPKHEKIKHPKFEYNKINSQVYIGTNACCQTHFNKKLLKKGITCDISLEGERMDKSSGVESYLWLPVKDHTPPSKSQMQIGVQALEEMLKRKKKIYIHCKNGHGRAPTFYASYLILKKGLTAKEAVDLIKKKRPSIHLEKSQLKFLQLL